MVLVDKRLQASTKKSERASSVLKRRFEKFLFKACHIFSAGLSSGLYGGINTRAMFGGTSRQVALWNAPLSNTTILNSSALCWENKSR